MVLLVLLSVTSVTSVVSQTPPCVSRRPSGAGWSASLLAEDALELRTEVRRAALRRGDPHADLPRRIVPHVLRVPALELGHPVAFLVLMVADDRAPHGSLGFPADQPLGRHGPDRHVSEYRAGHSAARGPDH